MEKLKHSKKTVFITAAAILLASAGVFIVSIQMAMGAEERKVVEQPSANLEAPLTETPQASSAVTGAPVESAVAAMPSTGPHMNGVPSSPGSEPTLEPSVEPAAPPHTNAIYPAASASAGPTAQPISEDEAVAACESIAAELFGMDIDRSSLTVTFSPSEDVTDDNGNIVYTSHDSWSIESPYLSCGIDGATGTVICFSDMRNDFKGESITEEAYGSNTTGITPDGKPADMHNSPDDMYIKAAAQIVNDRLAGGRQIVNIQIGATQYVFSASTMQVDCQVYMATGMCYTLSFWGTDEPVLKVYTSHPTQHACMWGYFYEEDGANYPPESANGEWYTAPGVEGQYSDEGPTSPKPSASFGN